MLVKNSIPADKETATRELHVTDFICSLTAHKNTQKYIQKKNRRSLSVCECFCIFEYLFLGMCVYARDLSTVPSQIGSTDNKAQKKK